MARFLKDHKIVFGYCRSSNCNIPKELIEECLKWYHLKYDHIQFDIYNGEVVQMIADDHTEWKAITNQGIINRMVSSSKGFNKGVHEWIIHCIIDGGWYQAIGIISDKWNNSKYNWFGGSTNGYCYYLYGWDDYQIKISKSPKYIAKCAQKFNQEICWKTGDNIIVLLDCDNWTISFKLNGKIVGSPVDIEPNLTYYPTIATCGPNDHYRVNE